MFQSAPLTEARGDRSEPEISCYARLFQSAPLTEARGDPPRSPTPSRMLTFQSAPLTEARGDANLRSTPIAPFQSAPLTEARGDQAASEAVSSCPEFQSAPLTEARGDPTGPQRGIAIRSPHRSKGRLGPQSTIAGRLFQSAPLTEARGDRVRSNLVGVEAGFQSAPLTEARGDRAIAPEVITTLFLVSIRSPHRSKGRRPVPHADLTDNRYEFQSAPLTEARGDQSRPENSATRSRLSFNPLPSPKQGETRILGLARIGPRQLFQSAPLTEARGDSKW